MLQHFFPFSPQLAIEKFSEIKRMSDDEANNNFELQAQCQRDMAVQQAVIAKTYHIIALQGKLLAQNEEMDCLRKEHSELKNKNNTINKQVIFFSWTVILAYLISICVFLFLLLFFFFIHSVCIFSIFDA